MAIFVKHLQTGNEYLFLGTSLRTDKTFELPNLPFLRGNLAPEKESEENNWVALCDQKGTIFWLPNSEVIITEIEGKTPSQLLEGKITEPATVILDQDAVTILQKEPENWENDNFEAGEEEGEDDDDWI